MGFRCLDPETLEVRTLLHVSFDENSIEHRRDKLRDWDQRADAFKRKQLEDLPLIQDDWEIYAKDHTEFYKARDVRRLFVDYDKPYEHAPLGGEQEADGKELLEMTPPLHHATATSSDATAAPTPAPTATSSGESTASNHVPSPPAPKLASEQGVWNSSSRAATIDLFRD